MQSASAGFAIGLSLIIAIGAQNAFILRQGLRREHVFAVCLLCGVSDAVLIGLGVSSFGWFARVMPWVAPAFLYGGVAFLIWYGLQNFRAALRGGETLEAAGNGAASLRKTLLTCLALTWLNPHVYLDTLVLVGSLSTRYASQLWFAVGAMTASVVFFFALGYGARLLAPLFARPVAWRILDMVVALTMWAIAVMLLLE